jgi:UDP-glucose 4-epimerase
MMMKAIVTGGAGFIGSNIVQLLLERGHEVLILDNLLSGHRDNITPLKQHCQFILGDVRDRALLRNILPGADAIFHLAASVGNKRSIDDPGADASINVMGTVEVMEAAREASIPRVVVSSSAGIFGELKTLPITEDHPVEPDTPYGASKLFQEKFSLSYAKLYKMGIVCLRYFNVYGRNQRFDAYGNVIPIFAHRMLSGNPIYVFGDGEQTRDFINVRDVAEANLAAALTLDVSGAFNIGSGTRVSINQLVTSMSEVTGIATEVIHTSPRPGDVRDSIADIRAAHSAFHFEPTIGLREGLEEYIAWLRATL